MASNALFGRPSLFIIANLILNTAAYLHQNIFVNDLFPKSDSQNSKMSFELKSNTDALSYGAIEIIRDTFLRFSNPPPRPPPCDIFLFSITYF
jgi:hypothetical protein